MLRVNNRKVISQLAMTTYRANRKRNLLTILAVSLTAFLIASVLSLGAGYRETVTLRQLRMEGIDYDVDLTEPTEEQVELLRNHEKVKYAGLSVKCGIVSRYGEQELDKVKLYWLDDICWDKQTLPALESWVGTYPREENEILLSQAALRSMGIQEPELGMELPLTYQNLSENSDGAELEKKFVLCGWFLDYSGAEKGYVSEKFYKTTGVRQTDITQGTLKLSLKNPLYSEADLTALQIDSGVSGYQVIRADPDTIANFCRTVLGLLAMLFLVFFSGYLFIYNTLYLSVNQEIRYYGQLKTLGITSVQLKRLIYRQMIWNSCIGISCGLLAAGIVSAGIVPRVLHTVNPLISTEEVGAVPFWAYLVSAVFAFATIYISSRRPIAIADHCSPVEAMHYIGADTLSHSERNVRRRSRGRRGGSIPSMVRQNLLRDKRQLAVILLSLSLGIALFLVINVVISANNAKRILNTSWKYDLNVLNQTMLEEETQVITDELIGQIQDTEGVAEVRVVTSAEGVVPYQEEVYGEYYRKLYASRYSPGNYEEDMALYQREPENDYFTCRVVGVDEAGFERLNRTVGNPVSWEDFKRGTVCFASTFFIEGDCGIPGKTVRFSLPEGLNPEGEEQIEIAALIDDKNRPYYYAGGYTPDLIVSSEYLETLMGEPLVEQLHIDYEEPFSAKTEAALKQLLDHNGQLSTDSKLEQYGDMKNSENQVTVLGSSIGGILLLLALLNYMNMMASGIRSRSGEFAILESIGMTTKQLRRMIFLEGISYALLSILIALVLGIPASYAVFQSTNQYGVPFSIPWGGNLLLFVLILAACVAASLLILHRTRRETIIELLRREDN